jgi:hypothetical protein
MSALLRGCAHARALVAEAGLTSGNMTPADTRRWESARSAADLGALVCGWLEGSPQQTPSHCGPPCRETVPLIPVLKAVNRAGFVTETSQQAGASWGAYCFGFAADPVLDRLAAAFRGTGVHVATCRGSTHHHYVFRDLDGCPGEDAREFWSDASPGAAGTIRDSWYVMLADSDDGRTDRLWPALERFARGGPS